MSRSTDLPPLARISAAIEKLERLKAESTEGPWEVETIPETGESRVTRHFEFFGPQSESVAPGMVTVADADLIVTLHRTIDCQLRLLREMKHLRETGEVGPGDLYVTDELASAILGGES